MSGKAQQKGCVADHIWKEQEAKKWILAFSACLFYLVQDPRPWNGATHIEGGSSLASEIQKCPHRLTKRCVF